MTRLFDIGFAPIQKRTGMGLQYIGSKEAIAPSIINEIAKYQPNATHAFDLFGGGGAMSLAFVASGLTTTYNELKTDMCIMWDYTLECIKKPRNPYGIFDADLYEFCDRPEFKSIYEAYKANEPLTPQQLIKRYIYSFNCYGDTYYKNRDKTTFAKAGHQLIMSSYITQDTAQAIQVFKNYAMGLDNDPQLVESLLQEFITNPRYTSRPIYERRLTLSGLIARIETISLTKQTNKYIGNNIYSFLRQQANTITGSALQETDGYSHLCQMQHIQQLERLENTKSVDISKLTITNKSYADYRLRDTGIASDELVCLLDPPYDDCDKLNERVYASGFSTKEFLEWSRQQVSDGYRLFLTEYKNPDPSLFTEIAHWDKISATTIESKRTERLFMACSFK